jgi:hypothetical protein
MDDGLIIDHSRHVQPLERIEPLERLEPFFIMRRAEHDPLS